MTAMVKLVVGLNEQWIGHPDYTRDGAHVLQRFARKTSGAYLSLSNLIETLLGPRKNAHTLGFSSS